MKSEEQASEKYFHWRCDFSNASEISMPRIMAGSDAAMLEPRHEISILPASVPFPGRYVTRIPTILKAVPRIVELHCKSNASSKYTQWKMLFSGKDGNDHDRVQKLFISNDG